MSIMIGDKMFFCLLLAKFIKNRTTIKILAKISEKCVKLTFLGLFSQKNTKQIKERPARRVLKRKLFVPCG